MPETTIMTTIGEAPTDVTEAPAEETAAEPTEAPVDAAAPTEPTPAPAANAAEKLELAKRYERAAQREAKSRQALNEVSRIRQEMQAEREAFAKEQAQFRADLEAFRSDPVGFEIKAGRDPVNVVRRASTPETPEQKEIRELKEWKANFERSQEEQKTAAQKRAEEQHREATLRNFVSSITPDECPNVTTLYRASEVPALVNQLLNEPNEDGQTLLESFQETYRRNPTNQEIKQALEHRAAQRAKGLLDGLKRHHEPSSQAATADPNASASTRGPSLSNQHAGRLETANGGGRKLSLEERRAINLKSIRDQLEAESESS